jgi:mannose-6-phosphate isomerase-like protein (cupin superfamily)
MKVWRQFPSASDLVNLSRTRTQTERAPSAPVDYRRVVVKKPWGFEYLFCQTSAAACWVLSIDQQQQTSIHCHVHKKTALIVLGGAAVSSTLDGDYPLVAGDAIVLHPRVFHSTRAIAPDTWVMEIETPVLKDDLVRLSDAYGRQGTPYEGSQHHRALEDALHPTLAPGRHACELGDWHFSLDEAPPADADCIALVEGEARPVRNQSYFLTNPLGEVFTRDTIKTFGQSLKAVPSARYLSLTRRRA